MLDFGEDDTVKAPPKEKVQPVLTKQAKATQEENELKKMEPDTE